MIESEHWMVLSHEGHWSIYSDVKINEIQRDCGHYSCKIIVSHFFAYLPCLSLPSLSPHPLFCPRLSALCSCISEPRWWGQRVDLAVVPEVYMLSHEVTTMHLFKHKTEQEEREQSHMELNSISLCRALSIFHPFCVFLSELQRANLSSPNIV